MAFQVARWIGTPAILAALAIGVALGGCSGEDADVLAGGAAPKPDSDYALPPHPTEVRATASGVVVLGKAEEEARIRAVTPTGKAYGATAGADGRFSLEIPRTGGPMLVALSAEGDGRSVASEGWLFIPPDQPTSAILLRAGAPALPLGPTQRPIAAIDYDASGSPLVSGVIAPRGQATITLDAATVAQVQADAQGVYGARFGQRDKLGNGSHRLRVVVAGHTTDRQVAVTPPAAESFSAVREPGGWRISWATPGAGRQVTFLALTDPAS